MSKFILVYCGTLVYYGTDFGIDLLGEYATKQDAFNAMIREIERTYKPCVDMSKCRPDDNGNYEHKEDRSTLYWGDDWANCYGVNAAYSDHYKIFEV